MQLGMIGLGRMGGNMVRRLLRAGHECVVFDVAPPAVAALAAEGATGTSSLDGFVDALRPPRAVWLMVPAALVDPEVDALAALLAAGDVIIDGGNSHYHDDIRRAAALAGARAALRRRRHQRRRLGPGARLLPDDRRRGRRRCSASIRSSRRWPPARARFPRRRHGRSPGGTAEQGYLHCGPAGAGHFVKMVHNGIEYGLMAAYAEGLQPAAPRRRRPGRPAPSTPRRRRCASRSTSSTRSTSARSPKCGGAAAWWRRGCSTSPPRRSRPARRWTGFAGRVVRLGRRALDHRRRHRGRRAGAGARAPRSTTASARAAKATSRAGCSRRCATSSAGTRSAAGSRADEPATSDALVVFGVTGDLAYKQIFPALHAMVRRGQLDVPVLGVARAGSSLEELRARARAQHRGERRARPEAFAKLSALLRYVGGNYEDAATYARAAPGAGRRVAARLLPGDSAQPVRHRGLGPGRRRLRRRRPRGRREAVRARPRLGRGAQRHAAPALPRGGDLPHRPLPGQGAGAEPPLLPLRQLVPRADLEPQLHRPGADHDGRDASASRAAASSTRRPARSATWCRTTCCRSSACWRWRRRAAAAPSRCATRRRRPSARCGRWPPPTSCAASSAATASEPGVAADSQVETFAAVRLHIDSWRWAGVPFYIRAGKHLPVTTTEVLVELKRPPVSVFPDCDAARANHFRFRLSPQVVLSLGARAKTPGEGMRGEDVDLIACHNRTSRDGALRAAARRRDARRPDAVRAARTPRSRPGGSSSRCWAR